MTDLMQSSEWLDETLQELLDDLGLGSWKTNHLGCVKAKQAILQKFEEAQLTAYNKGWSDCNRQFVKVGLDSTRPQGETR